MLERIVRDLEAVILRVVDRDRLAAWPGISRGTPAAGTADFATDTPAGKDGPTAPPATGVPIRVGLAGAELELADGSRALIGYEGGDPRRPYVTSWDPGGAAPRRLRLRAERLELQGGDAAPTRHVATVEGTANLIYQVLSLLGPSLTPPVTPPQVMAAITGGAPIAGSTPPPAAIIEAIEAALASQTAPGIGAADVFTG